MTFTDRTKDPRALRHWYGDIEADYVYTSGVAGERFFRELRDHGRLLGTAPPASKYAGVMPPVPDSGAGCQSESTVRRPWSAWLPLAPWLS